MNEAGPPSGIGTGRSPGRRRERGPFGAGGEPGRHWGLSLLKSVWHLLATGRWWWPHLLARVSCPGLDLLLGKGAFLAVLVPPLPSPPNLPGSSRHQLSPDLVFRGFFLVQAKSFHLSK